MIQGPCDHRITTSRTMHFFFAVAVMIALACACAIDVGQLNKKVYEQIESLKETKAQGPTVTKS